MLFKQKDTDEIKSYVVFSDETNYHFAFNKTNGMSVRQGLKSVNKKGEVLIQYPDPRWSPEGPELLDICITEQCDRGCPYCYQAATPKGQHMDLDLYRNILEQTKSTIVQIALGGGEVTVHPDFVEILRMTREDFGIVPNYTTNGDWIFNDNMEFDYEKTEEILEATKKYCGAVAISNHGQRKTSDLEIGWEDKAVVLAENGIKTNIHYILGEDTVVGAAEFLRANDLDDRIFATVFLLYKPIGRAGRSGILKSYSKLRDFLEAAQRTKLRIGFDACSAPFLCSMTDYDTVQIDTCEGGRFSGYVHVDGQVKACSFDKQPASRIQDKSFIQIWKEDLQAYRDILFSCKCKCKKRETCYGGCPLEKEIVLCDLDERSIS